MQPLLYKKHSVSDVTNLLHDDMRKNGAGKSSGKKSSVNCTMHSPCKSHSFAHQRNLTLQGQCRERDGICTLFTHFLTCYSIPFSTFMYEPTCSFFHFYVRANLLIYNAVVEKVSKYAFVFFTTNEILFIFSVFNQICGLWIRRQL
jgi:hypothetical protein